MRTFVRVFLIIAILAVMVGCLVLTGLGSTLLKVPGNLVGVAPTIGAAFNTSLTQMAPPPVISGDSDGDGVNDDVDVCLTGGNDELVGPDGCPVVAGDAPPPPANNGDSDGNAVTWPKTAQEAAVVFGGTANRWEHLETDDGGDGWHLNEDDAATMISPAGYLGEGYFDSKPGRNANCFAFTIPVSVQGATIWRETGTRERAIELATLINMPTWDDGTVHECTVFAQ